MTTRNALRKAPPIGNDNVIHPNFGQHYSYRRPSNILEERQLLSPQDLIHKFPVAARSHAFVDASRQTIKDILSGRDHRFLVIVGPCSIHNLDAALEYGQKLKALSEQVNDTLYLVMRSYFEKPRSSVGWQGLINDPFMDNSFCIEEGLVFARQMLSQLAQMGMPTAIEALDPLTLKYLQDLVSWTAIGARTTESQPHRKLAGSLDCAVGFKNGTDGSISAAINSIAAVSTGGQFLNVNENGHMVVTTSQGNPHAHVILRGGGSGPNYTAAHIEEVEQKLKAKNFSECIMIDCSHDNSNKNPANQLHVIADIQQQILQGNTSIKGVMLESYLEWGNQPMGDVPSLLKPGVSVTDACIDWSATEDLLLALKDSLQSQLLHRHQVQHSAGRATSIQRLGPRK